ncbi:hypothetical protein CDL15_Pgr004766 [Punica granatum]|uniref:Uncharacterized protein n=1 Tax=Punica granatum TaxID=22663 RepID=A0A218W5X8_PUNGR|nr:hypothetical protein CDL15_Pgr004766 [Punica granatum]
MEAHEPTLSRSRRGPLRKGQSLGFCLLTYREDLRATVGVSVSVSSPTERTSEQRSPSPTVTAALHP